MTDFTEAESTPDDRSLGAVVAGYLCEGRSGRRPERAEYIARFPELAAELESFFAEYDAFDRLSSPLRDLGREIEVRHDDGPTATRVLGPKPEIPGISATSSWAGSSAAAGWAWSTRPASGA